MGPGIAGNASRIPDGVIAGQLGWPSPATGPPQPATARCIRRGSRAESASYRSKHPRATHHSRRLPTTCWCRRPRMIAYHHQPRMRRTVTSSSRIARRVRRARGTAGHKTQHELARRAPRTTGLTRKPATTHDLTLASHLTRFYGSTGLPVTGVGGCRIPRRANFHTNVVRRALLCSNAADHLISYLYSRTRAPNE
jgi:hypothetical protein